MMEDVGTRADVPILIKILRTAQWDVSRASAATTLGKLRTKAGEKELANAVSHDPTWMVRAYAAQALTSTGDNRFRTFIEARIDRERDSATIVQLYACMVDMNFDEYIDKIIDVLFTEDHWYMVYLRAAIILQGIFLTENKPLPDRAIEGLKRVIRYDVGLAAKWAARDVLKAAGIKVKVPPKPISKSSGTTRA
jgi:HEAT repeat protein